MKCGFGEGGSRGCKGRLRYVDPDVTRTRVDRTELLQYFPVATAVIEDGQAGFSRNEALDNWPLVSKVARLAVLLASPIALIKGGSGTGLVIHNRCSSRPSRSRFHSVSTASARTRRHVKTLPRQRLSGRRAEALGGRDLCEGLRLTSNSLPRSCGNPQASRSEAVASTPRCTPRASAP